MRLLLCNDDGIHAPGIIALHRALAGLGEIMVVAPLTVQSATGHGITFSEPIMTKRVDAAPDMRGTAVDARPADCVKVGIASLWPKQYGAGTRPDLVISGMNMGANVGINVLYSGTCAAALEAAFLGVPSIAVSLHHGQSRPDYDAAARHARTVIDRLLAASGGRLAPHECLNLNIPITERPGPLPPVVVCPMNTHGLIDSFDERVSPMGDVYYWSAAAPMGFHATEPGSDVDELIKGRITVTPLRYDLTSERTLARWSGLMK